MNKQYETIQITILYMQEEIVRTSTGCDGFDDDYKDPNINFGA